MPDQSGAPPSISLTACDERGRNGVSSVLASATACRVTCRMVCIRSGSDSRSFHGACSEKYLLASPITRMASLTPNLNRECERNPPTPAVVGGGGAGGGGWGVPAGGIEPMFRAANETARLTRFPQVATSSSLLRRAKLPPGEVGGWGSAPGRGAE